MFADPASGEASGIGKIMYERLAVILTELRRGFEVFYGERLVQMMLFGSQARGDAEPESDIDVLVVLQGPVDSGEEIARTGELTAVFSLEHDVVISRVFVSAEQFFDEQSPLLLNVRREGIPL
jgi:predicted nucleotidyltransferase